MRRERKKKSASFFLPEKIDRPAAQEEREKEGEGSFLLLFHPSSLSSSSWLACLAFLSPRENFPANRNLKRREEERGDSPGQSGGTGEGAKGAGGRGGEGGQTETEDRQGRCYLVMFVRLLACAIL